MRKARLVLAKNSGESADDIFSEENALDMVTGEARLQKKSYLDQHQLHSGFL